MALCMTSRLTRIESILFPAATSDTRVIASQVRHYVRDIYIYGAASDDGVFHPVPVYAVMTGTANSVLAPVVLPR